jgi:hypothetical protein
VQPIIVNCVSVVNPQLAPVIGGNPEMVTACPEDSQAACPTHSKVITSGKTRPSTTCVAVVDIMLPASHVCLAIAQPLASATLTKVEDILSEQTVAISGLGGNMAPTTCKHNCPSVRSIIATITELNPRMTTTLKHLKSHEMPSTTKILGCFPIPPAMQAVVVDRIAAVQPQLAAIIGDDAKPVMSCLEDSEATCPTHGEVICSGKTWPPATCVAVVDILAPALHVGLVIYQILAPAALTKVEDILSKETSAVEGAMASGVSATGFYNSPSHGSVRAFVPE